MERRMIEANSQYRKGIAQAAKDNVYIVGKVYHKDGDFFGYAVQGKQEYPYLVTQDAKGLHCNCVAGQRGNYCKHRAICTQNMIEDAARKAAQDALNAEQEADRAAFEAENGHDIFDADKHTWTAFDSVDALFESIKPENDRFVNAPTMGIYR